MALRVGVIGGTGFYDVPDAERLVLETPFGDVEVARTRLGDREAFFLPRHGARHEHPPHRVNHRANVTALRSAKCDYVIGVLNVGSLSKAIKPGAWGVMSDFIDHHRTGPWTFYNDRAVHVGFDEPVCPHVVGALQKAGASSPVTYVGVDGPRFETPAEVRALAATGGHVVGMTGVPEASLAHEIGLCYGALVFVGNYATGIGPSSSAKLIQARLVAQRPRLNAMLGAAGARLPAKKNCDCAAAGHHAALALGGAKP